MKIWQAIIPYIMVGLLGGGAIGTLSYFNVEGSLAYLWFGFYGFFFLFAWDVAKSLSKLGVTTMLVSFLACMPFVWQSTESFLLFFLSLISLYALNAYHIAYQQDGLRIRYDSLFLAVWDTFVKLIIVFFFVLFARIILSLWAMLYSSIEINFFETLFDKDWFMTGALYFFAAMGLYFVSRPTKLVSQLRSVFLSMCKFLLPFLSVISILFIITSLITLALGQKPMPYQYYLFIGVSFLGVLFVNGVYQNGEIEKPFSKPLLLMVNLFVLLLPLFSITALITLLFHSKSYFYSSIIPHGLNESNFIEFIVVCLLVFYTCLYAFTVLQRKKPWLKNIGKINVALGLVLVFTVVSTNNYFFSHSKINPGKIESPCGDKKPAT